MRQHAILVDKDPSQKACTLIDAQKMSKCGENSAATCTIYLDIICASTRVQTHGKMESICEIFE